MLVAAGMTPDAVVKFLYGHVSRNDGKLDLWCNDNQLKRSNIRQYVRFELGDNDELMVFAAMGVAGGWGRADLLYSYEVEADSVEALIAELAKPKKSPGRHQHPMRDDILAEYDRRCAEDEPHETADLEAWATKELKNLPKYKNVVSPPADTIGRWLRERPPTK
jgi:hypothetical protein